jgi:hypothetical protein
VSYLCSEFTQWFDSGGFVGVSFVRTAQWSGRACWQSYVPLPTITEEYLGVGLISLINAKK